MLPTRWIVILIAIFPFGLHAQERYAVSYGGFAGHHAPLWAAKDLGLFAKYGLNVDPVMIAGSARGMQTLLSGSTHLPQPTQPALPALFIRAPMSSSWRAR